MKPQIRSNQFPVHKPVTAKKWALFAGNEIKLQDQPYPVLVSERDKLAASGIRFLKIKTVK